MTELETRVRETLMAAARDGAPYPPDPEDLLARAQGSRATRRRGTLAAVAAAFVLTASLVVLASNRDGSRTVPAASPSTVQESPPDGWTSLTDNGLRLSIPPGTVVNPSICPFDGRPYVLTGGRTCQPPADDQPLEVAPIVLWIHDDQGQRATPPPPRLLQTIDRDGLSGFVEPMMDPGFIMHAQGASYTWTVVENTTTTAMYLFGKDQAMAQQVIDSMQRAR